MPWPFGRATGRYSDEGRQFMQNEDGTLSTERTITIQHPMINGGKFTNIPSLYFGYEYDENEAIQMIIDSQGYDPETGRYLPGFDDVKSAVKDARKRSKDLGE